MYQVLLSHFTDLEKNGEKSLFLPKFDTISITFNKLNVCNLILSFLILSYCQAMEWADDVQQSRLAWLRDSILENIQHYSMDLYSSKCFFL